MGFYGVMRKAIKTSLKTIIERKGANNGDGVDVFLTTFSPLHFERQWDKFGACPRIKPYTVEGVDAEMRAVEVEEMETAKLNAKKFKGRLRLQTLDVTKLHPLVSTRSYRYLESKNVTS